MNWWKRYVNTIKDPDRDPYDRRFRLFLPFGVLTALLWLVVVSIVDFDWIRLGFFSAVLFLYAVTFLVSVRTGHVRIGAVLCTGGMVFVAMPFVFWREGGVYAGAFNYTLTALIFIMMTLQGKLRSVLVLCDLAMVSILFYIMYAYPSLMRSPERSVLLSEDQQLAALAFLLS